MKIYYTIWPVIIKAVKIIKKILLGIVLSFPMAMGNIFYSKPNVRNETGNKNMGREKED